MAVHLGQLTAARSPQLGGEWHLGGLTDITVLFGRNGIGKSHLLRGIRDQEIAKRHYASPERGGDITFDSAQTQQEFNPAQRQQKRGANFQPTYRSEAVSRIATYLQLRGNSRDDAMPIGPSELERLMSELMPGFRFEIQPTNDRPFRLTRLGGQQEVEVTSISQLSSGEADILTLGIDLLTMCAIWEIEGTEQPLLLIDSPDPHLHPELQQHLAEFIVTLVDRFELQVVLATHSTTLLAGLGLYGEERTSVVYLNPATDDQLALPFNEELEVLAACLGGHALMGPLFAHPLLLVEGDDDYKIWSEAARRQTLRLAVIPCDGSRIGEYRKALERVFDALCEDEPNAVRGYMLRDRDETLGDPDPGVAHHMLSLKLACRESENLYLSDEVLAKLNTNWAEAAGKIAHAAPKHGQKTPRLQALPDADRKTADLKNLMEELVAILDDKKVDWRLRVGQVLGADYPDGQLAEFLGIEVVHTLWGAPPEPPAPA